MKEELISLREQESIASKENKEMTGELREMRSQLERLVYESKEAAITQDAMREQNGDLAGELEDLRVSNFFSFLSFPRNVWDLTLIIF